MLKAPLNSSGELFYDAPDAAREAHAQTQARGAPARTRGPHAAARAPPARANLADTRSWCRSWRASAPRSPGTGAALEHYFTVTDFERRPGALEPAPHPAARRRRAQHAEVTLTANAMRSGGRDPPGRRRPLAAHDRTRTDPMTRACLRGTVAFLRLGRRGGAARRPHPLHHRPVRLPARAPTASQRVLIEQLREGPAARLIIAALGGGMPPRARGFRRTGAGAARRPAVRRCQQRGCGRRWQARSRVPLRAPLPAEPGGEPQRFSASGLHAAIAGLARGAGLARRSAAEAAVCPGPDRGVADDRRCLGTRARAAHQAGCGARAMARGAARAADPRRRLGHRCAAAPRRGVRAAFARARATLPAAQRAALTLPSAVRRSLLWTRGR